MWLFLPSSKKLRIANYGADKHIKEENGQDCGGIRRILNVCFYSY